MSDGVFGGYQRVGRILGGHSEPRLFQLSGLEESENIAILRIANAAQVIENIDSLPAEERSKVIAHLHQVQEERFHEEQVRIAEQRLEDLENGRTGTVSHKEAMRAVCRD